ncbi:HipA domain-containing protein [Roseimarinus sediminis]|uniref:HipA domain-containing protein n=1 Tax=Roseimarinus sediminis TaxID=1610899 RepID=UPI003D1C39E2
MKNRCLYCYQPIDEGNDFHEQCAREFFETPHPPLIEYSLDQMDELAKKVVERSVAVPGVQAKLSMSLIKATKEQSDPRLTVIDALGGLFILKPPTESFPEMPENEHVSMRIAAAFGIRVVPSTLIRLASGELSYLTKRIDRTTSGAPIHMIDLFQITEAFDKYKSSMERVGKAIRQYSDYTLLDLSYYFELSIFCFITGNNDMHLKNFSMIESPGGWTLAPSYDLLNASILLPEDKEELALTLSGKKSKLKREHFVQFGEELGLNSKQIDGTLKRIEKNAPKAIKWIRQSFLSTNMKNAYLATLEKRYRQLGMSI